MGGPHLRGAGAGMEDDLRVQVARLEERMKTMQAEYKTDIAMLAKDLARRETKFLMAIAGLLAVAVAFLKYAG